MISERFRGTQVDCLVKQIEKNIFNSNLLIFRKKKRNIFLIIVTHNHKEASYNVNFIIVLTKLKIPDL